MAFSNEDLAIMETIIKRYPRSRSAIMPLLHFVQALDLNEFLPELAELANLRRKKGENKSSL